jgi:hypothetical protein
VRQIFLDIGGILALVNKRDTFITSFVVMKHLNIAEAFAKDKHFSQSGFTVLLK